MIEFESEKLYIVLEEFESEKLYIVLERPFKGRKTQNIIQC